MSEHDEQVKLFQLLSLVEDRHPAIEWIHAIPNGGKRHPAVAKKMKAEGVKPGISDVFVPYARRIERPFFFNGFYIEMKYGKNKPSEKQAEFLEYADDNDYKVAVCYSAEEAFFEIMEYLSVDVSDIDLQRRA